MPRIFCKYFPQECSQIFGLLHLEILEKFVLQLLCHIWGQYLQT